MEDMDIDDDAFWRSLEAEANSSGHFQGKARSLSPLKLRFRVDMRDITLNVANGRAIVSFEDDLRGFDLRVSGPRDEWQRVLSGTISYPQAVNHVQGRLRQEGDMVAGAWAMPVICAFFKPAPAKLRGKQ